MSSDCHTVANGGICYTNMVAWIIMLDEVDMILKVRIMTMLFMKPITLKVLVVPKVPVMFVVMVSETIVVSW